MNPKHAVDFREVVLFDGVRIVDDPTIGLNNLQRECTGGQNKREQGVRV
jgi:hypothetical protein